MVARFLLLALFCVCFSSNVMATFNSQDSVNDLRLFSQLKHYVPRSKREVVQRKLQDPDRCIEYCNGNETTQASNATTANTMRIISIGMADHKRHPLNSDKDMLEKRIHELTISNMGPLFEDLCKISMKADECIKKCPNSQLRDVSLADHNDATFYCEPSRNWPSFVEYYAATDCNNKTVSAKPCDTKCGPEVNISRATHLELNVNLVRYETNVVKNTEAATSACKSLSCHIDCNESILKTQCGAKAFDTYQRLSKLEPGSALAILELLQVIDLEIPECSDFYKKK